MKYVLYLLGIGLLIWALIEQANEKPNLYVQIAAVIVFFIAMMKLMDKAPSKNDQEDSSTK